jgi:2-dehydropantoate 2-reductase
LEVKTSIKGLLNQRAHFPAIAAFWGFRIHLVYCGLFYFYTRRIRMKILIYGAGPLGSLFAVRLIEAGHDVSLLARGQRLKDLQEHGIIIEDSVTGVQEQTPVNTVEALLPDDDYELVMVVMRKNQALQILPTLSANKVVPTFLFMMNDMAGPGLKFKALGSSRLMRGFPLPGGMRDGPVVRIVPDIENRPWEIPIGEVDGRITARTRRVAAVLESMRGFKVDIRNDMDAWLKYHVALVVPLASAFYAAGGEKDRFLRTRDALILGIRAQKEALRALRKVGVKPTPAAVRAIEVLPEPIALPIVRWFFGIEFLEASLVSHAQAAADEMGHLMVEMLAFFEERAVETPTLKTLYKYYDPNQERIPDGSAKVPLDWRGIVIPGGILLGSLLFLRLMKKKCPRCSMSELH